MVLLKNDRTLPLTTTKMRNRFIGPLANQTRCCSAITMTFLTHTVSILEGLESSPREHPVCSWNAVSSHDAVPVPRVRAHGRQSRDQGELFEAGYDQHQ